MRKIVRFCASCYRNGEHTELPDAAPGVPLIIGKYGAFTDLCENCEEKLLDPLLELMSSGEELSELSRADWAQLGSIMPTRSATLRRRTKKAGSPPRQPQPDSELPPAVRPALVAAKEVAAKSVAADRTVASCKWCGETFTRKENLRKHIEKKGDQPHERKPRRGAAIQTSPDTSRAATGQVADQMVEDPAG